MKIDIFCRELKDDSLRKKFRSLAQKLREIILKQKVAILSGTPVRLHTASQTDNIKTEK